MLSTCCVQHVAAGGLNRVTAEARFLSLFWFYLWGKTQVHSGSTDVPVLQWNWEAAHVCGSVRICPPNPTWARGVTCAYQAIRPCVFTANVPAVSDVCVHRKLPMIPELNKLRVFVQVWMCAFVKSFYMFVNLSQSCKQSSFSKEKKWFRK